MPDPADSPFPYRAKLDLPVIGMESEFTPIVNGEEVVPEDLWRHPSAFIDTPMLKRTSKSSQLPGGGAIYFDGGVSVPASSSPQAVRLPYSVAAAVDPEEAFVASISDRKSVV